MKSALYQGRVTHTRFGPRPHALSYRIFMLFLDLDEAPALARGLRLFSLGRRFNLTGFDAARHGDGSATPLKLQVEAKLRAAGLPAGGPVRMLCMPRILGHGFNPLTIYWCHAADGQLSAMLYEVNNTFGERHSYLIPAEPDASGTVRQQADKAFYVSPFMDMGLTYLFRLPTPGETVLTSVDAHDAGGRVLAASFAGERRELSDRALLLAWLSHPWMTVGVLAAIHLEALKIWLRGEPLRRRAPSPRSDDAKAGAAELRPGSPRRARRGGRPAAAAGR